MAPPNKLGELTKAQRQAGTHIGHAEQLLSAYQQFVEEFAREMGVDPTFPRSRPGPQTHEEERVAIESGLNCFVAVKGVTRLLVKAAKQGKRISHVNDVLKGRIILSDIKQVGLLRNILGARRSQVQFLNDWAAGTNKSAHSRGRKRATIRYMKHEDRYLLPNKRGHMDFQINFTVEPTGHNRWEPVRGEIQFLLKGTARTYFLTHGLYEDERGILARAAKRAGVDLGKFSDDIHKITAAAIKKHRLSTGKETAPLDEILSSAEKDRIAELERQEKECIERILTVGEKADIESLRRSAVEICRREAVLGQERTSLLCHDSYHTRFDAELYEELQRRQDGGAPVFTADVGSKHLVPKGP